MEKPLRDVCILDISEGVAGPYAASLLGDMGASVIKVEKPEGDWGRGVGISAEEVIPPQFAALNRNKKNLCMDLKKESATQIIRRLVQRSDVIISNFRKGVMERLGAGYRECQSLNPRIIYCTISGFGQKGEYADLPATDAVIQALSGIMDSIGELDGPPLRVSFPVIDLFAASLAVQGIMVGLYARHDGKSGKRVDVSLINAAMALQAMTFTSYLFTGERSKRCGHQNPFFSPGGAFRTKDDRYLTIAVINNSRWESFCRAVGHAGLAKEERFKNNKRRIENRLALNDTLIPIFLDKTRDEWMPILKGADVLCAPINTFADVAKDNTLGESLSLLKFDLMGKESCMVGNPIEMDGKYPDLEIPPCRKGEHSIEILKDLDYSPEEIKTMLNRGIVIHP